MSDIGIRRVLLPGDSNHHGKVFGGAILAELDLAGAVIAGMVTDQPLVTRAIKDLEFTCPLDVGEIMTISGTVEKVGETSITVALEVVGQTSLLRPGWQVATATVVYVAVDEDGNKTQVKLPLRNK